MPKLSTKQEGHLYSAFISYCRSQQAVLIEEKRLHMDLCNHALHSAGLPPITDLLASFKGVILSNGGENDKNGT